MPGQEVEHVLYRNRKEWSDVTPILQDDGSNPVVVINYKESYRDAMNYFRAVSLLKEFSPRALELTSYLINVNPSHYTIWGYRQRILKELQDCDLRSELEWLNKIQEEHPKSYQSWHHRMWLVELLKERQLFNIEHELDYVSMAIVDESKNYHVWAYRQWLVKEFDVWEQERVFVEECIKVDVRNNSAWNQRYFLFTRGFHPSLPRQDVRPTSEQMNKEVVYVLGQIARAISNESPWMYLRGILEYAYGSITANPFTVSLIGLCKDYINSKTVSLHVYIFLLAIFEEQYQQSKLPNLADECKKLCSELETKIDPIRANYWAFRSSKFI